MLEKLFTLYWITRIKNNYKRNNLKNFIINIFNFLKRTLVKKKVGELPFKYFFIKKRRLIREFCLKNLTDFDDQNIKTYYNYYLDSSLINKNSIIYSFGLSTNIKFEEQLAKDFNVNVYCFDPTPSSVNYMMQINNLNLIYKPFGIYTEDKKIKFYSTDSESKKNWNGSILKDYAYKNGETNTEYLQCYKLKTLLDMNNHKKIDILKIDIEGVAIEVLHDVLNDKIYPEQIAVEFEVAGNDNISKDFLKNQFDDILKILNKLKSLNYKIYHMPRFSNLPYSCIEVLCIRK